MNARIHIDSVAQSLVRGGLSRVLLISLLSVMFAACGESDNSQSPTVADSANAPVVGKSGVIQPDDSQWRMSGHDSQHTGRIDAPAIESPRIKWKKKLGERIFASAAVGSDGTIYTSAEGDRFATTGHSMFAFDPKGELRWSIDTSAPVRTTPVVATDSLLFGAYDGIFHSVTLDGVNEWTYDPQDRSRRISLSSPVMTEDGTIYFGDHGDALQAISSSGESVWSFDTGDSIRAAPAIGSDGSIYVGSNDGFFYAVNPDGTLKWSYKTGGRIDSPATLGTDDTVYFGSENGKLYALDSDGQEKWVVPLEKGHMASASPALGEDGTIYVGTTGTSPLGSNEDQQTASYSFIAVSPQGEVKWRYSLPHWIRSSAAVVRDGSIYFGCWDGNLYSLTSDGELNWKLKLGDVSVEQGIESSPAVAPDGTIYVGTWDGWFYAIEE